MDEQYYWIKTISLLFGFWGTIFKFWAEAKEIKEEILHKMEICVSRLFGKNKIRDST